MQVNAHIFIRVFWSIVWRVTLIGAIINSGLGAIIPAGKIENIVVARVEADMQKKFDAANQEQDAIKRLEHSLKISENISFVEVYETSLRYAQEAIREQGLFSLAYLRDMLITLLPTMIATVIAVSVVLEKQWKRFALQVRDHAGNVRPTLWRPALAFSFVQYAPLFIISGAFYYIPWFTSSWGAFLVWNLLGLMIYTAGVYGALRFPYRSFRLHIAPVTAVGAAA